MTNQFKSSIISVATIFWPYIFFLWQITNQPCSHLWIWKALSFCLIFFFTIPPVTGRVDDGSKQILNFFSSVSFPKDFFFFFLMKFSNLESLSFEDFLLWKSAPVKFRKELSLPLRKQVILLPTKLEISLLWLSHRKIKIALTNLRIIRCKKNPLYPFFKIGIQSYRVKMISQVQGKISFTWHSSKGEFSKLVNQESCLIQ